MSWNFRGLIGIKKLQWTIVRGMILKGTIYKRDFLEFLDHPVERIKKARYYASDSAGWYYGYGGVDKSLAGLQIDWQHKTMQFPGRHARKRAQTDRRRFVSHAAAGRGPRDCLSALLVRPDSGLLPRLRHQAHLHARASRAGVSARCAAQTQQRHAADRVASRTSIVLDERLFNQLEHPDLFWDALAFESDGMEQFSRILATEVRRVLGPPQTLAHAVQHSAVLRVSRRRSDPVLYRAAFVAEIHSARRQLLLLHELESEVHSAAAHADRHRLHGGALDLGHSVATLAQSGADRQPGGQSRLARIFQVLQFLRRQHRAPVPPAGERLRAQHHSSPGHQLSYLPEHVLRHRRVPQGAGTDQQSHRLRAVHFVLPATGGRAHRSRARIFRRPLPLAAARLPTKCCAACCWSFSAWPRKW